MNIFDLTGKTALITGASSGLGERFARCLSGAGVRVILAARRMDKLDDLAKELGNAVALEMDVLDKLAVYKAFEKIEKIDICINNAGIASAGMPKFTTIFDADSDDQFEAIMQTNVMGVWYVTRAAANHMKQHKTQGSIINIASIAGASYSRIGIEGYCISKAAVIKMTTTLVGALAEHQIRINAILPGMFLTQMTEMMVKTPQGQSDIARIPLGFVADPSDLDGAILYLASNKASRYVTGSCITVDGGRSWGG